MCSNFTVIAAKLISYLVLQLIFVYIVTSEIGVCHIESNFRSSSHCRRNNRRGAYEWGSGILCTLLNFLQFCAFLIAALHPRVQHFATRELKYHIYTCVSVQLRAIGPQVWQSRAMLRGVFLGRGLTTRSQLSTVGFHVHLIAERSGLLVSVHPFTQKGCASN